MGLGASEIAIEVHYGAGDILTKRGVEAQIGISGCLIERDKRRNKNKNRLGGIPIEWSSAESPMVETSIFAVWIQDLLRGFGTARFLKVRYMNYYYSEMKM